MYVYYICKCMCTFIKIDMQYSMHRNFNICKFCKNFEGVTS